MLRSLKLSNTSSRELNVGKDTSEGKRIPFDLISCLNALLCSLSTSFSSFAKSSKYSWGVVPGCPTRSRYSGVLTRPCSRYLRRTEWTRSVSAKLPNGLISGSYLTSAVLASNEMPRTRSLHFVRWLTTRFSNRVFRRITKRSRFFLSKRLRSYFFV